LEGFAAGLKLLTNERIAVNTPLAVGQGPFREANKKMAKATISFDRRRGEPSTVSLLRRLKFSNRWQSAVEPPLSRWGLDPGRRGLLAMHTAANYAFDLVEAARMRGQLPGFGRLNESLLDASIRIPQPAPYRCYWYDRARHAAIGLHLGIDIIPGDGRYYVLENNIVPALRSARRELYAASVDPFISELARTARANGFRKLVFYERRRWASSYVGEFQRASQESGIEVIGASADRAAPHFMPAIPETLEPATMYVLRGGASVTQRTPLLHFIHDKYWAARWLTQALEREGDPSVPLACVPTYDRFVFFPDSPDGRWPNLVVKLADADKAEFVAMGRFRSEAEARAGLGINENDPRSPPAIFNLKGSRRLVLHHIRQSRTIYQPFIVPDLVDDCPRKIRLHVFVSPAVDAYLSAHSVIGGDPIPKVLPPGPMRDPGPFVCNFIPGNGTGYALTEASEEQTLRAVAIEFGQMAKVAVSERFETGS
jgi:hypothetical protein